MSFFHMACSTVVRQTILTLLFNPLCHCTFFQHTGLFGLLDGWSTVPPPPPVPVAPYITCGWMDLATSQPPGCVSPFIALPPSV